MRGKKRRRKEYFPSMNQFVSSEKKNKWEGEEKRRIKCIFGGEEQKRVLKLMFGIKL